MDLMGSLEGPCFTPSPFVSLRFEMTAAKSDVLLYGCVHLTFLLTFVSRIDARGPDKGFSTYLIQILVLYQLWMYLVCRAPTGTGCVSAQKGHAPIRVSGSILSLCQRVLEIKMLRTL